ncbi:hypothetical protein BKA64DRAFT_709655 [Cadophora sp. MPI-SDFR-AT-0126]|nr:hypothetical protein BKA64DRAFT_709655 [Leotiomycetes sp. MPI-SDFR-AT-0126]
MKKKKNAPVDTHVVDTGAVAGQRDLRRTVSRLSPVVTTPVKTKRRKKAPLFTMPKKGSKKVPVFDAFEVKRDLKDKNGTRVQKIEVVAPETGIHSQEWASKIVPQPTATLLRISLEVRIQIFELLFRSYYGVLSPKKRALRGIHPIPSFEHSAKTYTSISLVCRQVYVEVAGGALLYKMSEFYIDSGLLMGNNLTKINRKCSLPDDGNPRYFKGKILHAIRASDILAVAAFHVSSITSTTLCLYLNNNSLTITTKITWILSTAHSLKRLSLFLDLNREIEYLLLQGLLRLH